MTTLTPDDHVVVVGAGLAGWRLCEALRREGFDGAMTLIGDEPDPPYDRPPLSKQVLAGKWTLDQTTLATGEKLAAARVRVILGTPATSLDVEGRAVHLGDGRVVTGSRVVIATGSRARLLPVAAGARPYVLRSRADAELLLGAVGVVGEGATVVVVGGGFVGAEVATSLRTRGLAPVVLEALDRPLVAALGEEVSGWLEHLAGDFGVELRCNERVVDVVAVDAGSRVELVDGALTSPVVVVAAGSAPNVEWLGGSGLGLDDGVVVDEVFAAAPGVAGDRRRGALCLAQRVGDRGGAHRALAERQRPRPGAGARVGRAATPASLTVPYFWSDQYGKKIQVLGHPHPDDDVTRVHFDEAIEHFTALYSRAGMVTGVSRSVSPGP